VQEWNIALNTVFQSVASIASAFCVSCALWNAVRKWSQRRDHGVERGSRNRRKNRPPL